MVSREQENGPSDGEIPAEMGGLRMTKQRRAVYEVLLKDKDHPTANELFRRLEKSMPSISLATVYNCLEALVEHGLINQVNFDREPSRFCSNLKEHVHFHDEETGVIHDITFKKGAKLEDLLDLPKGTEVTDLELTLRGQLPRKS